MRILVAEDDLDVSNLYKKALDRRGHQVVLTSRGDTCIQTYLDNLPSLTMLPKSTSMGATTAEMGSIYSNTKSQCIHISRSTSSFAVEPSYDVVILDYKMPGMNGMEVAKEILEINPHQRIIFASAYVEETLQESVKQLNQVVELIQKPFTLSQLVNILENKESYEELKKLNVEVGLIRDAEPSHEILMDLLERLQRIQKEPAI
jgi:CheY-like chemotaxis protein